nr:hypothetical protein [Tanacetum cinerariifolium]
MDDSSITMKEYIRLEEEKAHRHATVFNDAFTSEVTPSYEPMASPLNGNKINFRISFDESDDEDYKESVGTSTRRVILFGTILTTIPDTTLSMTPSATHIDTTPIPIVSSTIPPSPDYTPTSPDYTPALPDYSPTSDTETDPSEDPSSDHIPPLPATSPFLSSTNDSSGSDIPDTTPSPTHGTPFNETTLSTQRSPTASGKRVGPSLMRHSNDYSFLDHFDLDDSSRDSSSSSSSSSPSETSSDPSSDDLSDSSSDHLLPAPSSGIRPSHHLCLLVQSIPRSYDVIIDRPSHDSSSVSPSRKRSRSPATSVPLSSPIPGSLSYACADFLPSPKRIWSSEFATELEEIKTGVRGSVEVRVDRVTHPVIVDDIHEPAQEEGAVEVTYETLGDLVQRFHDHTIEILVHRVQPIKGPCTVRCRSCKRVGHITRDCKVTVTPNTQRAPVRNQPGILCYECGRPCHFKKDCPKLRNLNHGNQIGNKNGNKTGNQTRGNESTAKAYAIRGG